MKVDLAWHEVLMASEVGRARQLASIKRGLADKHGFSGDGWSEHVEGACGEMVVAKALGVYWDGSVNTFKAQDLPGLQVRTRSRHSYDLIVRPADSDDEVFVLVTGQCPSYRIRGWIVGGDAKQDRWLKAHGGRPDAYFVPAESLMPFEQIRKAAAVQDYKLT